MLSLKKNLSYLIGLLLVFMLAACGQTAKPVNESANNNGESNSKSESKLTLEEVLEKSTAASENLKSFSVKMEMTQNISSSEDEMNMDTHSSIDMDVVMDPMAFYQKMSMTMGEEKVDMESYFTEDGMYLYEPSGGEWIKFPQEMTDMFLQMAGQQQNPGEELKKLQKFVDDFTFEQDDKNFILKLKASGDKFNDFIKETAMESMPAEMADEDLFSNMKINSVDYEILVDKETFNPVALKMDMDMEMTVEEVTISLKQAVDAKYLNLNKVDVITVPQEVLDSAVEMDM
ncbi:DUF6612 family protein [Bacillus sp. Bva_UNVM-123]|uniref:DUF6612 family protein n=1 Tax=Bacillus sp. Bva_UNVM-123 TaxID=2829798 RepID=UPI00391FBA88